MTTINDVAWNRVFAETDILSEIQSSGLARVTAETLRQHGNREPRLMAKLDTLAERPESFKLNAINILPVHNGEYVIFSDPENKSYYSFGNVLDEVVIEEYNSPFDFGLLDAFPISRSFSESQAIDYAFTASLLKHFLACSTMHLSIRGRSFSGTFDLTLPQQASSVVVSSVQIEVDAGYETTDSIVLIEAKVGRREDFNIRQLVYPYLQWSQKSNKRVRPVLLMYSNGKYFIAEFTVGGNYGQIEMISVRGFTVNDSKVAVINLGELFVAAPEGVEPPSTPFPQANDLDRVVDLVQLVSAGTITKMEISDFFEFDERQADYYANAAAYLGFVQRSERGFSLTEEGDSFLKLAGVTQRTRTLVKQMLRRPSLRASVSLLAGRNFNLHSINDAEIAEIVQRTTSLTGTTPSRRASTVRQWLKWLLKNCSLS